ncbi:efflux RND transporter permease subunit [Idiomarina sp. PL1-037]|uniref:efflux RND transporter permease subunit n=1 Tax=unclassified Idiomarina TaxID=2614829 RepID=UPI00294AC038|nr:MULTISPECIES: efflux RND transporter permease subunit [unclassified Idiomarina]MDV6326785.1 efflux RND transporter permease subunit [Idiomarina sp. Sol25]WQC54171.1 efflux RND transporter permease subunit [Idiomarina sp. PL1-037]
MAKFFINRPIFAWVLALLTMMAGAIAMLQLPIAQYPTIAPPAVEIQVSYPGANAETVSNTVTKVIEQNMTGVDNLLYFSSQSNFGSATVSLTFASGTDPDIAQVQVQNKLSQATPQLPQAVQAQGITVSKASSSFLMVAALVASDDRYSQTDLSDYIASNIQDPIARTTGVGNVQLFGSPYSMRIWVDPSALVNYGLTMADLKSAIRTQNAQVAAGELGGTPAVEGQRLNATIIAQTRMSDVSEFENITLKVLSDGSQVRLKDVAEVEKGAENYSIQANYNGKPATGLAINLQTGANALETADAVKARMAELEEFFPDGMELVTAYDTTPFIKISISEVAQVLIEAIILVFLLMFVFLQNLRATLIPTLAIPVVILGTMGVLALAGFSINTLTMFGMVLSIGLLVDDAIVVVENVERLMSEEGLSPKQATIKSMGQITGALVAIGVVMAAVFAPMAFFPGATGAVYRQFSLTIITSMGLSVLVAIVFSPALCATLLKPVKHDKNSGWGPLGWFNRTLEKWTDKYTNAIHSILRRTVRFGVLYLGIIGILVFLFMKLPSAFLPEEDRGVFLTQMQLPVGSTLEQSVNTMDKIENYYLDQEDAVQSVFSVVGFSFSGRSQANGIAFVRLKDWSERDESQHVDAVIGRAFGFFASIKEAMIFAFNLPPIPELGVSSGFNLFLQDRGNLGHTGLLEARNQLLGMAGQNEKLVQVRPNGLEDAPQLRIDIDFEKAQALGLTIASINETLSTAWGSSYVNDFIDRGRVKKVYLQGEAESRMLPEDINEWYVKNNQGDMVPFSSFSSWEWTYGAQRVESYNGVSAMEIQGQAAPGVSTGEAMIEMEKMIAKLPPGIGFEWTGISLQERQSGDFAPILYSVSLIVVFLFLAALYESWSIPFSVMLVVPLGILGAVVAVMLRGISNDVYFQVGLLTTVGVSARNAILIVEFAKDLQAQGKELLEATLEAVRLRLRPILMTSLAFVFGVMPLALSDGAGAASRNAIGTSVIGGMIGGTVLAIFFVPLFFYVVRRIFPPKQTEE